MNQILKVFFGVSLISIQMIGKNRRTSDPCLNQEFCTFVEFDKATKTTYLMLHGIIPDPPAGDRLVSQFAEQLNKNKGSLVIVLNSLGGSIPTANKIHDLIKTSKRPSVTTYLPPHAVCASSCITLFAAAKDRIGSSSDVIAFHSCEDSSGPSAELSDQYLKQISEDVTEGTEWIEGFKRRGYPEVGGHSSQFENLRLATKFDDDLIPSEIQERLLSGLERSGKTIFGIIPWSQWQKEEVLSRVTEYPDLISAPKVSTPSDAILTDQSPQKGAEEELQE
jgi:hypothetical protein